MVKLRIFIFIAIFPIECKKTAIPAHNASKNFNSLEKLDKNIGHCDVICFVPELVALSRKVDAVPVSYL